MTAILILLTSIVLLFFWFRKMAKMLKDNNGIYENGDLPKIRESTKEVADKMIAEMIEAGLSPDDMLRVIEKARKIYKQRYYCQLCNRKLNHPNSQGGVCSKECYEELKEKHIEKLRNHGG